ncbi:hypothetical protein E2C01_017085 [Portunus trituberculatus]|uniref:Uncharacterized protein n=1 Tax=Portunus trituberculatus TaxID=210409 RepID=A0A5B7DS01_PORTR|nr:hypothetical protein [Portunus trituberculatus]
MERPLVVAYALRSSDVASGAAEGQHMRVESLLGRETIFRPLRISNTRRVGSLVSLLTSPEVARKATPLPHLSGPQLAHHDPTCAMLRLTPQHKLNTTELCFYLITYHVFESYNKHRIERLTYRTVKARKLLAIRRRKI